MLMYRLVSCGPRVRLVCPESGVRLLDNAKQKFKLFDSVYACLVYMRAPVTPASPRAYQYFETLANLAFCSRISL